MSNVKQVIVVRKDLNMRKGKLAAQVAHGSMIFLLKGAELEMAEQGHLNYEFNNCISPEAFQWINKSFTKVVVSVDSEKELDDIYEKAKEANLETHLVTDKGLTEFGGIPTKTVVAIGPNYSDQIDKVTGDLKLL